MVEISFGVVDVLGEGVAPGHGGDGEDDPKELRGDVGGGAGGEGSLFPEGVGDDRQPEDFVEDFKEDDREHLEGAEDAEDGERGKGCPDAPGYGVGWIPRAAVGEDVRPGELAEDEEHKDVEEAKEIDVEGADAFVFGGGADGVEGVEGHGSPWAHGGALGWGLGVLGRWKQIPGGNDG